MNVYSDGEAYYDILTNFAWFERLKASGLHDLHDLHYLYYTIFNVLTYVYQIIGFWGH